VGRILRDTSVEEFIVKHFEERLGVFQIRDIGCIILAPDGEVVGSVDGCWGEYVVVETLHFGGGGVVFGDGGVILRV